ncbi:MAG: serine kinase [Bacteroidetes bacterium]|nr:MAG: serine kinase [Bacteroidota bacterium]
MTVEQLKEKLGLKVFGGEQGLANEISGGYVSDLLSDVMGNADTGQIWITLQTHKNVMAIASLKDLVAIILVKNHEPEEDTLAQSNEEGIPLLGTNMSTFELSGKIYELLK